MQNTREPKIILLEFNELSPDLMDRFIEMGELPHFKRLRDESQVLITEATERGWELNPWVQWVTVHSGLDFQDHRIIELDEGHKLRQPRVWDVVSQAGRPVWLCGSMNIGYERPLNGLVLPDPWTTQVEPSASLKPFFRFVQRSVLEHSSNDPGLGKGDYLGFLSFMATHGLSPSTGSAVVRQLFAERTNPEVRWKRAVLLDQLQFDVFRWHFNRLQPAFSTFFCNSTAHFQHYHWREMDPHLFATQPSEEKLAAHDKTILFGYQQMDHLVGRFLDLLDDKTVLVFATAISQQPCLIYEEQGGKVMYRPRAMARLIEFAGVTDPYTATPLMAEVFNVQLQSVEAAERAAARLLTLHVEGRPAILVQQKDALLNVKCCVHARLDSSASIVRTTDGVAASFHDLFFELEDVKSGMHHPDGMFWVRIPGRRGRRHDQKEPLAAVAPTLLNLLDLPAPGHMRAPISVLATTGQPEVAQMASAGAR